MLCDYGSENQFYAALQLEHGHFHYDIAKVEFWTFNQPPAFTVTCLVS